jgi:hypothetical protein
MVSIRKYLEMRGDSKDSAEQSRAVSRDTRKPELPGGAECQVLAGLCAAILDQIVAYVLQGEAAAELRARLETAKSPLLGEIRPNEAVRVEEIVRGVLSACAARDREGAQRTAVETQRVVGVLNMALMVLAGGSKRSLSRLQHIQASLQRTSQIRDAEGLRASLADAMKLIRDEAAREQISAERDLAGLEAQVVRVREQLAANPVRRLPGRDDAIRALADTPLRNPDASLYVMALSIEQIKALVQRYGPEPVDELFFQLIRERVHPVAPACVSCRWSQGCIVSLFEYSGDADLLRADLAELCRAPVVYRMTLGSRTAVLKVAVSYLLTSVPPLSDSDSRGVLVSQLDRFGGTEGAYAS